MLSSPNDRNSVLKPGYAIDNEKYNRTKNSVIDVKVNIVVNDWPFIVYLVAFCKPQEFLLCQMQGRFWMTNCEGFGKIKLLPVLKYYSISCWNNPESNMKMRNNGVKMSAGWVTLPWAADKYLLYKEIPFSCAI